jgi:2,4-dienoyl-CoA reductase-like NADH-dependent reductase (Old Yellow Enzyme family)
MWYIEKILARLPGELLNNMMNTLFESSKINTLTLANRFIRSATWAGMADDDGNCTAQLIELMTELAKGGVGLIITGHSYVHQNGRHSPWQLGIDRDELIPGLKRMTREVHEHNGKIAVQLGYGGAYLSKSRVRSMSVTDIQELVEAYGQAAIRAKEADFDAVQIFAAHGFFLSQLLCPRYNDRTDQYGGDIRNRARVLLEVMETVRQAVGPDYPVLVKLNAQDFVENGMELEEAIQVGLMLEDKGVNAIELSGGLLNNPNVLQTHIRSDADEAYLQNEARAFQEKIKVPLILVGGIRSYNVARQLIEQGVTDYISMCRPFICEPDLVNRWQSGNLTKAACISCNNCIELGKAGHGISCIPLVESEPETFFPQLTESIPASHPHPPGTNYKISIGLEQVDAGFSPVVKVEMEHNGKVLGQTPYFPLGSDDYARVSSAIEELLSKQAGESQ